MTGRLQINVRSDQYTDELVLSLMKKTGKDKSKIVRDAIEFYAAHVLGHDEIMNISFRLVK